MKISAGDAVTLKSSDVVMTVMKHDGGDGDVVCGWHDKNGQFQTHAFSQHVLVQTAETKAMHEKAAADQAKAKAEADAKAKAAVAKPVMYGGLGGPGPVK